MATVLLAGQSVQQMCSGLEGQNSVCVVGWIFRITNVLWAGQPVWRHFVGWTVSKRNELWPGRSVQ